jgi:hypothetical protein
MMKCSGFSDCKTKEIRSIMTKHLTECDWVEIDCIHCNVKEKRGQMTKHWQDC